jgi:hypothetical protein
MYCIEGVLSGTDLRIYDLDALQFQHHARELEWLSCSMSL